ncbi:phosphoribosylamine--glycine ligase [Massilia sp. P8910]|uniref:phosphoribosylamine--glycine ligase n=1 Tax=Massilia antarctica TaxID=2765360 RepID=UPI0006BB55F7|nr:MULTISPECIES: phosphoribosylamine--glycine ligase [Massilia]MCE3604011.1 phosphoribosylamine--glycine ligase [Massilia antarctica]MCY0911106.1 phosphoribosylamine--glycine ligase [Massilia sp. H27-R4]CUI05312.1 Phosphoribosylamine--glycine ligase [Janthinobacterium sp. CG23_2]CUU29098.1 Phosphoribosylamine--glycine ligase [Janthinobacterium sp. CG23_2]
MKILVVGSGGREHALAWKLAQSERIQMVYVAPGNGGTARDIRLVNVELTDPEQLAEFVQREGIALTVVGPETPLAAGIVNLFRGRGLKIFGPTKEAAQLESSKDFAKAFMQRHGIPTATYQTFSDVAQAHAYIDTNGAPIVIKADGLAAGKGVVVAMTLEEAHQAVDHMLADNRFGDAGARIVIEEFLAGEEASFIVMCDGKNILPLATSQDHKRLKDADEGPNTGGMGAYSPAPIVTPAMHARVMREIINPTINGMAKDGIPFTGFLYAGLMIDDKGNPKTLEFNCRMGDPETQPIMARLKSDLVTVMEHAVNGTLDTVELEWDRRTAVGVVMAAAGYPDDPRKGDVIDGIPAETPECVTFHAGTQQAGGKLVTSGGRVLCVVGLGDSVKMAQKQAYETVDNIHFNGAQFRRDIGWRGLKH